MCFSLEKTIQHSWIKWLSLEKDDPFALSLYPSMQMHSTPYIVLQGVINTNKMSSSFQIKSSHTYSNVIRSGE